MAAPTRLILRFTPFPPGFQGDLSKYNRALIDRIEVLSPYAGLQWQIGGIKPTSNVGPWLNDLGQPFVWDETLKDYKPMDISLSLGSFAGDFAALQALVANRPTYAEMNAAIAAAISGATPPDANTYPAAADAGPTYNQIVLIDATVHKINLNSAYINADGRFDAVNSRYLAPVHGFYRFSMYSQVDNSTGVSASLEVSLKLFVNGTERASQGYGSKSPPGDRWWPGFSGLIELSVNDQVEVWFYAQDGVNTGNLTVSDTNFAIELVKKL